MERQMASGPSGTPAICMIGKAVLLSCREREDEHCSPADVGRMQGGICGKTRHAGR